MYSVLVSKSFIESDVLTILEHQSLEYCTSVALDLYRKSNLSYRIVSEETNKTVVSFIR